MRVAVTGGTGFVGTHLVPALRRAGRQVTVVARSGGRRGRQAAGLRFVRADVASGSGLRQAFDGCDAVINLVAVIREKGDQTFDRVNRQGTENVVAAAREAGVSHLLHLSAIGADPDPSYPYAWSKWEGEQAVVGGGVPYTMLRSSLVFGPGDGFFTVLGKLVRLNPVVPIIGDGRTLFQPIAAEDIARCLVIALERGAQQRTHEVGGPQHLSYEEIVDIIKEELGAHRFKVHIPVMAMMPVAVVMDRVLPHAPVTPGELRMLGQNNITRLDAVPKAFGFPPQRFEDNCAYLRDY